MSTKISQLLAGFPVVVESAVQWGEMDAMGHVNNAVYFRYFETARIAYFETTEFFSLMNASGLGPILAHTDCRFRLPLKHPDELRIGARVVAIGDDRLKMEYRVVSVSHGAIAAEGTGRVVSYDYAAAAKAPFPDAVRSAIVAAEGRELEVISR
ncbi:MAG: thioesterase family protein [Pseudomonadota bacterium]